MRVDRLPPGARRLTEGEQIAAGDLQAIGEGFYVIAPCATDRAGRVCCVGRRIEGHERYYRAPTPPRAGGPEVDRGE